MSEHPGRPGTRTGRLILALLALVVPVLLGVPVHAEENPDPISPADPLTVHLLRLTPETIPTRGKIILAGTVTNDSDETWSAINVHAFISKTPMTSREELAVAAQSAPDSEVGERLVKPGQFTQVGDLEPGQRVSFRIALPVQSLGISGAPGVYWVGVHALGQNSEGRDTLADGRARTFIPLVPDPTSGPKTSVALVVPVRERVRRDPEGRVLSASEWATSLAPNGRLGRLAAFLETASGIPATLMIDPAVLEAVDDLKHENPPISLGTNPDEEPGSTPSPTPSRDTNRLEPADQVNASNWLNAVIAAAQRHTTLGLAYADPDTNSLARRRPLMLQLAERLSAQTFSGFSITARPVVAPPKGWLDEDLLDQLNKDATLLVSDHSAPRTRSRWSTSAGQDLVFTDEQAGSGGTGPTSPTDALALRQRIISDAALRVPEGSSSPMVVQLPNDWNPGESWQLADFFNALNQPWLSLVPLEASNLSIPPTFTAALAYPRDERRDEIPPSNISTARTLIQTTTVFAKTLRSENTIAHDLAGIAFDAVSYHALDDPLQARQQVAATDGRMRGILGEIRVIGTDFVTLSGGSGTLAVTVVNGLDHPIVVGVRPRSSNAGVEIDDTEPFEMAPGERTVLRLHAESAGIGVDQVVLTPVTSDGTPLGTPLTFRLRTSQVGNLIWGVLGAGALLLVVMIGRRIRRGLREHRWRRA